MRPPLPLPALALLAFAAVPGLPAQSLPATPTTANTMAPIDGIATPQDRPGAARHRAEVTCNNGELTIRADNSSLNGILRAVSRCTGMTITGGVVDQRVFGNYGPAAPATVLATLLDGTGVNMLLQETAADQPARLVLTPRTGGPTPPSPSQAPDTDTEVASTSAQPAAQPIAQPAIRRGPGIPSNTLYATEGTTTPHPTLVNPGLQPYQGIGNRPGSAVTSPPSMPQPINNVNGSPSNTSPTASTYPTTNSVPLDTLPTPSTTPSSNGIVDAPNPPAAGSDTAALLNGSTTRVPATTNVQDRNTSNTTLPAQPQNTTDSTSQGSGTLTPQQVFDQLRRMQQEKQQTAGTQTSPSQQTQTTNGTPQPASSSTPQ